MHVKLNSIVFCIILLTYILCNKITFGQTESTRYNSPEAKLEVEALIGQFNPLIEKLPTYKTYSPAVFTLDNNDKAEMMVIFGEISPKDIHACRVNFAKVCSAENSLMDKKLVLICFVETIADPLSKKTTKAVSVYAEHIKESKTFVYYYPYIKTRSGQVKFNKLANFTKTTEKIIVFN